MNTLRICKTTRAFVPLKWKSQEESVLYAREKSVDILQAVWYS